MNGFRWPGRRHVAPETPLQLAERLPGLRVDPRLVHTSETPQEPAGEAGVDAEAQADTDAQWAALKAQVDASKQRMAAVAPPTPAPLDLGTVVDAAVRKAIADRDRAEAEKRRQQAARAAQLEREKREAAARGGPCQFCGLTLSWVEGENGEPEGRWYDDGRTCAACERDRTEFHINGRRTDPEHRVKALRSILPADVLADWYDDYLLDMCKAFRWWRDTPGAATVEHVPDRFRHVDRAPLIAALQPPKPECVTRDPCLRCGCASRWLWTRTYNAAGSGHVAVEQWQCDGCRNFADLNDVVSRRIHLTVSAIKTLGDDGSMAPRLLGYSAWSESGAPPCAEPFGFIDWAAVTRRAFELFPGERKWGSWMAWQAAKAAAQS